MKYTFHPHARQEAASALDYYTSLDQQLGRDFLAELHKTINRIVARPVAWSPHTAGTRCCRLHRFPYSVVYKVSALDIRIVAVVHQHRKPDYWLRRIDQEVTYRLAVRHDDDMVYSHTRVLSMSQTLPPT